MDHLIRILAAIALAASAGIAQAAAYEATPADYRQSVKLLQPGDTLLLAAGDYPEGLTLHELSARRACRSSSRDPSREDRRRSSRAPVTTRSAFPIRITC